MRVRASVKRLCEACRVVKRRGKIFIVCKDNKKHKQRQGLHTLAPAVGGTASFMDPGASIGMRLWLQSQ